MPSEKVRLMRFDAKVIAHWPLFGWKALKTGLGDGRVPSEAVWDTHIVTRSRPGHRDPGKAQRKKVHSEQKVRSDRLKKGETYADGEAHQ
jgi:hypothetical protein